MDSPALLMWGMLFGAIGYGFLIYGRRQKTIVPLCVGIVLCVFPYFIANVYLSFLSDLCWWRFRILYACEVGRVVANQRWLGVGPTGTKDVYMLYAECFRDKKHLKWIQDGNTGTHCQRVDDSKVGQ